MKPINVRLSDEAIEDLELGCDFYDSRESGVGRYFVTSLLSDVSSLRLYAGIHPTRFGYFRLLSKRFPFAIYYEIVADVARVVAVLDMRRDPKSIRSALNRRK